MYNKGIDFVVISHCKADYVSLLVKSIHRYVNNEEYTIYIVNNYIDEEKEKLELQNIFQDDKTVKILKGADQSSTTVISKSGEFRQRSREWIGKIDKCRVAAGSKYGELGFDVGLKAGNREFICALDNDAIFLGEWTNEVVNLLDSNLFVSNRWDPGNIFREAENPQPKLGMARPMFWFMKREEMEINNLYPNNDYRDLWGNITYFAQQNGYDFHILQNSYWNETMRKRYNVKFEDVRAFHRSNKDHLLNIPYGEQAWISDRPFFFHQTRGAYRDLSSLDEWLKEAGGYLND